ncbi:MAG: D-sedoheptulose 7-phosphate isomerase [bacterium]
MNYPYVISADNPAPRPLVELLDELATRRGVGAVIVTTNGCFDLLHAGHIASLAAARSLGDILIVGLNSDASVQRLKGAGRPIISELDRAAQLVALRAVNHVIVFDDALPEGWLAAVMPNIHCKSGDYTVESLPETAVVRAGGGEVIILPLLAGVSTSKIISRLLAPADAEVEVTGTISDGLLAGSNVLRQTAYKLAGEVARAATLISTALANGSKVLACGNGGSAADAQHFAAELVGRYKLERRGWPAIALTVDSSIMTSVGNDYGYQAIFSRQVEALGYAGDVLIAISTSGNSPNIVAAAEAAHEREMKVIAFTGGNPSTLAGIADILFAVPSTDTPCIQQAHIALLHCICGLVESELYGMGK